MIDTAIEQLSPLVGVKAACEAVGRARASHYRAHHPVTASSAAAAHTAQAPARRPARELQPRALSARRAAQRAVRRHGTGRDLRDAAG
jgi:putative transposase